jgi:hypothetical protein
VVHALAAFRLDVRAPTDGEARLVAAVFAARDGRVGAVSLPFSDLLAARQLAVVTALVPSGAGSVSDTVRVGVLGLGVVTAVLLWALLRRLGCGTLPAALAIAMVGVTPPAVALHAAPTAAAVAVPWLLTAALLCFRGRAGGVAAAVAAVVAVLTAPLVGAVLLAFAAHAVADRTLTGTMSRRRGVALAVALGVAAVAVAAASSGAGPWAGVAAPLIATPMAVAGAVGGLVVVAAAWRVRWARPLLTPAGLLLAVLLVPGPGRAAAALTALPLLGVVVAVLADDVTVRFPRVRPVLWPAAVVAAVAAALVAVVLPARDVPSDPTPASLRAWLDDQLPPGAALHADPLDRTELVAAGFPAERLRALGDPATDVDALLLTARPGAAVEPPARCPDTTLLATLPRWGGAPAEICGTDPAATAATAATAADASGRASRVRIGTALAGNPALRIDPPTAELLATGQVDPRVMIMLAALGGAHTVDVADFPPAAFEPPGALRRQVVVTAVDYRTTGADVPDFLRDRFDRQVPPFAPSYLRSDGRGLLVGYRGPTPQGLLPD